MKIFTDIDEARCCALECAVAVSCVIFSFDRGDEVNVELYYQDFLDYLMSDETDAPFQYKVTSLIQACRIKEAAAKRYSSKDYATPDSIIQTANTLMARLQSHLN